MLFVLPLQPRIERVVAGRPLGLERGISSHLGLERGGVGLERGATVQLAEPSRRFR